MADKLQNGFFIGPLLAFTFVAGICLMVCGLVLGLLRFVSHIAPKASVAPAVNTSFQSTEETRTEILKPPQTRCRDRLLGLILFTSLLIIVAVLNQPCTYVSAHPCRIRIISENNQPVSGLRVVRWWGFSFAHIGTQARLTDASGTANFQAVSVAISRLNRLELRWLPSLVRSWQPGQDSLPVKVQWPGNLAPQFDSGDWRPVIPGDPSAYTNKFGVYVRYLKAYRQLNHFAPIKIPLPQNTVQIGFPLKTHEVELQVGERTPN